MYTLLHTHRNIYNTKNPETFTDIRLKYRNWSWSWKISILLSGSFHQTTEFINLTNIHYNPLMMSQKERVKNHSLYHEILLLQKFNDRRGKVSKKTSLQSQKKKRQSFNFVIVSDCMVNPDPRFFRFYFFYFLNIKNLGSG